MQNYSIPPLDLALVTDIHLEDKRFGKKGKRPSTLLRNFTHSVRAEQPDSVIALGDYITGAHKDDVPDIKERRIQDIESLSQIRRIFASKTHGLNKNFNCQASQFAFGPHFAIGNHDIRNLKAPNVREALGSQHVGGSYSFDVNGYRIVIWDTVLNYNTRQCPKSNLHFALGTSKKIRPTDKERNWLKNTLEDSPLPVICIAHYSPSFYEGGIRSIITKSEKVLFWLSGHSHCHKFEQEMDTNFITVDAIAREDSFGRDQFIGAHARLMILENGMATYRVFGEEPQNLMFKLGDRPALNYFPSKASMPTTGISYYDRFKRFRPTSMVCN